MTLIQTARGTLINPAFRVPNLARNLGFHLRASDLSLSDGAAVTEWNSPSGLLPSVHRAFNQKSGTVTYRATGGPDGSPAVEVSPGGWLRNFTSAANGNESLGITEFTFGFLFKFSTSGAFVNNSTARVISGPSSYNKTTRPSGGNTLIVGTGSSGGDLDTIYGADTDWIGVVWTGLADARGRISGKTVKTYSTGSTVEYRGLTLGHASNITSIGVLFSEAIMWTRALRDDEIVAQGEVWSDSYGVEA